MEKLPVSRQVKKCGSDTPGSSRRMSLLIRVTKSFPSSKKCAVDEANFLSLGEKIEMLGRGPGNQFSLKNVHCVFGGKHVGMGEREREGLFPDVGN